MCNEKLTCAFCVTLLLVAHTDYAVGGDEPFARERRECILLVRSNVYYGINLRMEPDETYLYYFARIPRDSEQAQRTYSDVPTPAIRGDNLALSQVWVRDGRVFVLAPPTIKVAPAGANVFRLDEYPEFETGRHINRFVPTGKRDAAGHVVQRNSEEERVVTDALVAALKRGESPLAQFGGRSRVLFHDSIALNPIKTKARSIAFVPRDAESGAVALLSDDGEVLYFRYNFVKDVFALRQGNIQRVGRLNFPTSRIFLTADDHIVVMAGQRLFLFRAGEGSWDQSELAQSFNLVGRIWDESRDEDILLGDSSSGAIKMGSFKGENAKQPGAVDEQRGGELRNAWSATRPLTPPGG